MESRKMILKNLFAGQQWRNRHREQTMDMGRGEERVRCIQRVTWKVTLPYVKQITKGNLLHQETQTLALYQPRGVDGEGDGEVQKGGDICIPMADSC